MAVNAIANIVKSSLGPVGLDKMLVDDIGVKLHALKILHQSNQTVLFILMLNSRTLQLLTMELQF